MFPTDVVIVAGARTPMARYTGAFSEVSAIELAAQASKEAIRRSGVDAGEFDHAIFGNVMQTSADALYGARHVGLKAGLKIETPAVTVNRLCGSGMEAIAQAAQRLLLGEANMVLAGGMENMTQAPFVVRGARTGLKLGGGALEDSLMAGLTDTYCGLPMALTAEKLAEQQRITRKEADAYALRSQQAADAAYKACRIREELVPMEVKQGRKTIVRARVEAGGTHRVLGGCGSRSKHHGDRAGAVFPEGAETRGTHAGADGSRGSERSFCRAVSGGGKSAGTESRQDERERRRDRIGASARGFRNEAGDYDSE